MKPRFAFHVVWIVVSLLAALTLFTQGCMMRHVTVDCRHHGKRK
jgi:hypothetical protein